MEGYTAIDAGDVVTADAAGVVAEVSADVVTVQLDAGGTQEYYLRKFDRSNQGASYNHRVIVDAGQRIEVGEVIADGPATENGELALGKNLLVAFMPWEGYNYEDAMILSQNLIKDDTLSSIHIEEYEVDARDTKLGKEEITRDLPTSARICWPTSTSAASSASAPRSAPATSSSARSRPRARPSSAPRSASCAPSSTRRAARSATRP
jgi:DNA-directed RNA polymerase subunit beta